MSEILVLATARSRGITLPADDAAAQGVLDETEAWLARQIGPLTGDRTERFYVGLGETHGKLGLARYTDSVVVTDAGVTVATDRYRLIDRGSAIIATYTAPSRWWTGPYVEVTYEPSDELEVRRVLYDMLALDGQSIGAGGGKQSETIGDYSYTNASGAVGISVSGSRSALVSSLLPKRDPLLTLYSSRRLRWSDPVINRAEPSW